MQGNVNIPDSTITTNLTFRQLVLMNMQQLTNFPYIEKDFDALTDYELLCLVVKFLNDVIANQNEQNDSITRMYQSFLALQDYVNNTKDELEDTFNNLDDYVRNFFDNLDVQEEINNKLDQMLEDGVLEQIIEQFVQSTAIWSFDNVANMKLAENFANGSYASTMGYYSLNDGGKAFYKIRTKTNEDVADEMFLIDLYDNTLIAELITDDLNIRQLGANGVVANDTKALKGFATSNIKTLKIPSGTYLLNDIVDLEDKELIGIGNPTININGITTPREHTIHVGGSCYITGINFIQTVAQTNIIGFFECHDSIIENCSFKVDDVRCNGYVDFYTDNHNIRVVNCNFDCTSTEIVEDQKVNAIGGIWIRQYYNDYTTDNVIFENCTISHQSKDEAIAIFNSRTPNLVSNCQINNCYISMKNDATNPHGIAISGNNCSMNNCIIERFSTNDMTGINISSMIHQFTNSVPVTINNCILNTNLTHANGELAGNHLTADNCVINSTSSECRLLHEHVTLKNSVVNCVNLQDQYDDVTITDCELNISGQTSTWLFRKTCTIINNTFNFATTNPTNILYIVGSSDTGYVYLFKGNIFNYYNNETKNFAHLHGTSGNVLYAYDNFYLGNITNEGTNTGVVANNLLSESLDTLTYIKTNNNFNINA